MPPGRRRSSQKLERKIRRDKSEEKIKQSARTFRARKARGSPITMRKHAELTGVDHRRLGEYLAGGRLRSEADAAKSSLGPEESQQLVDWLVSQGERGFPLTDPQIKALAEYLIRKSGSVAEDWEGVGKDWVRRFRQRHDSVLGRYWTKTLERTRANGLSPEHVQEWFAILARVIVEDAVPAHRIFAMDESGVLMSVLLRQMVTAGKNSDGTKKRVQHQQSSNNRELVTVITTICADGSTLRPTVIFKGANLMSTWVKNNPLKANVGMSEKGYSNNVIGLAWLKVFDAETRASAPNGEKRVLAVDGHGSHCTPEAIEYAREHNIEIIAYPPHTTHALQGLDVVLFSVFKRAYTKAVAQHEQDEDERVTKDSFLALLEGPWTQTFTPEKVKEAFRKTGVFPVDASVIRPAQMAPAAANSVRSGFPLQTPSPVRAIVAAVFPETPVAGPSSQPTLPQSPITDTDMPETPSRISRRSSSMSFPSTMGDRGHIARSLLRGTSASHLVSDDITPDDTVPSPRFYEPATSSPDWTMAQERTGDSAEVRRLKAALQKAERHNKEVRKGVRRAQATMVLQNAHLKKVNKKFGKKAKKRKDVRTSIFKSGHGAVITSDEAHRLVREDAESRARAVTEKEGRATERATRKADKDAVKKRNAELRADYAEKKKEWEDACAAIRAANPGKKRLKLPPRPDYPFRKGSKTAPVTQEEAPSGLAGGTSRTGSASSGDEEENSASSSDMDSDDESGSDTMSYESEGL